MFTFSELRQFMLFADALEARFKQTFDFFFVAAIFLAET